MGCLTRWNPSALWLYQRAPDQLWTVQMEDEVCRGGNFYLPNWQRLTHFRLTAQVLVRGR
jgi:hypothetical protein